ncbi:MAG: HAD family hydrolase [Candidatus Omnitrophica bacterium]|nr:HAD family hydrolase [Candidatus Omnitrophota bacterium]MDD5079414.1 HAD family hydrolase [Candidatus Omnitrophota bacterium]
MKLVIFDLDGTLIDAYPAINSSFNHTMRRFNCPVQKTGVIRKAVGWGDKNLLAPFVPEPVLEKALLVYRRHHKKSLIIQSRLFPGVLRLLKKIKAKGYMLAVASNRPTAFSLILMKHLKIRQYFDQVLCADKLKRGKPYPDILNKIIKRASLTPGECLYVGDMAIDSQAGARAGVKTVMVTTGSSSRKELSREKPFRIIPRAADLSKIPNLLDIN